MWYTDGKHNSKSKKEGYFPGFTITKRTKQLPRKKQSYMKSKAKELITLYKFVNKIMPSNWKYYSQLQVGDIAKTFNYDKMMNKLLLNALQEKFFLMQIAQFPTIMESLAIFYDKNYPFKLYKDVDNKRYQRIFRWYVDKELM